MSESVLARIQRAEVESRTRLIDARRQAEDLVEEARREAIALREAGERQASDEAHHLRETEMSRVRCEAEATAARFRERTEVLAAKKVVVPDLARRIVLAVAPDLADDVDRPGSK